jgi:hypothetical protein
MKLHTIFLLLALALTLQASSIKEAVSLAVTIYNDQFAMVKDVRSISFDKGRSDLYFTDVSSNIQPETVTFKALKDTQAIRVFEQNYEANLVNTNAILEKYINEKVEIYAKLGEKSYKLNGTLLGYNSGYILQTSNGIEVLNNIEGLHLPSLPEGFFTLPTLTWKVSSNQTITTNCEVAYRTSGFSWKADYSITLNEGETRADIGGWVSIDNRSGKRYLNAKLKLIAGDVNTVRNVNQPVPMMAMAKASPMMMEDAAPSFSEKSFSDYHMYTLSEPVTLNDNSQKQVEFIPKVYNVTVRKYNLITINGGGYSQTNLKASNKVEFRNNKQNGLGIPLPKGTVRVFKTDDSDGSLEFVGEDSIDHTPKDENITLNTGNAFDITANKYATNYQSFNNNGGYSATLNLTVTNHKDIPAEIVVELSSYGDNLKFTWKTQGLDIEKVSATLVRIKRVFKADEKFTYEWNEDYRP